MMFLIFVFNCFIISLFGSEIYCGFNNPSNTCPDDMCCSLKGICSNDIESCNAFCYSQCKQYKLDSDCSNSLISGFVSDKENVKTGPSRIKQLDINGKQWKRLSTDSTEDVLLSKKTSVKELTNYVYEFMIKFPILDNTFNEFLLNYESSTLHDSIRIFKNGTIIMYKRFTGQYSGLVETYNGALQTPLISKEGLKVLNLSMKGFKQFKEDEEYYIKIISENKYNYNEYSLYIGGGLFSKWTDKEVCLKEKEDGTKEIICKKTDTTKTTVGFGGTGVIDISDVLILEKGQQCQKTSNNNNNNNNENKNNGGSSSSSNGNKTFIILFVFIVLLFI